MWMTLQLEYEGDVREGKKRVIDNIEESLEEFVNNYGKRKLQGNLAHNIIDGDAAARIAREVIQLKENYKISIVIPCYNVENLIDRCLTSIINQTIGLSHMEIILINDASTDNTLEKLKQWEQKYSDNL